MEASSSSPTRSRTSRRLATPRVSNPNPNPNANPNPNPNLNSYEPQVLASVVGATTENRTTALHMVRGRVRARVRGRVRVRFRLTLRLRARVRVRVRVS